MRNMSKKTKKKIMRVLWSNHFESGQTETPVGLKYWPSEDSPLSAIWHHILIKDNGDIFGYLMDDHCCYCVAGSVARRKVLQIIRSPKQLFEPYPKTVRQAKQIAYRLEKIGRTDMIEPFWRASVLLSILLGVDDND